MTDQPATNPPRLSTRGSDQPDSPFDPFLARFLTEIANLPEGLHPLRGHLELAQVTGFDPTFAEALIVSARTRGLLQPVQSKGSRGRIALRVSSRGEAWLARHQPKPDGK
jgi:hypothetical protein